jgi:hypothetical protein
VLIVRRGDIVHKVMVPFRQGVGVNIPDVGYPQKLTVKMSALNANIRTTIKTPIGIILAQVTTVLIIAASFTPLNTRIGFVE